MEDVNDVFRLTVRASKWNLDVGCFRCAQHSILRIYDWLRRSQGSRPEGEVKAKMSVNISGVVENADIVGEVVLRKVHTSVKSQRHRISRRFDIQACT